MFKVNNCCPSKLRPVLINEAKNRLKCQDERHEAQDVARTWKNYGKLTRVEETVLYAKLRALKKRRQNYLLIY